MVKHWLHSVRLMPITKLLQLMVIQRIQHLQSHTNRQLRVILLNVLLPNKIWLGGHKDLPVEVKLHSHLHLLHSSQEHMIKLEWVVLVDRMSNILDLMLVSL